MPQAPITNIVKNEKGDFFYRCTVHSDIQVSHELRSLLRESVPYVKLYRYNTKHLCPKFNGYGDIGQRSLKL